MTHLGGRGETQSTPNLTSPSWRVFVTVIPYWWLTMWILFCAGYGLYCRRGGGTGQRVEPGNPTSEVAQPSTPFNQGTTPDAL